MVLKSSDPTSRTRYRVGLVGLFVACCWVFLAGWVVVPALVGWDPVVIVSGSMEPVARAGDVVVTSPDDGEGLGAGTVITFKPEGLDETVTHRIVAVTPTGEYVTQGDGNTSADGTTVRPDQVEGVGRILVPTLGLPAVWFYRGEHIYVVGWMLLMAFAFVSARWAFERPVRLIGRHGRIRAWQGVPLPKVVTPSR